MFQNIFAEEAETCRKQQQFQTVKETQHYFETGCFILAGPRTLLTSSLLTLHKRQLFLSLSSFLFVTV